MNFRTVLLLCLGLAPVAQAGDYEAPRMAWGHPDLQGIWTNATVSTLTPAWSMR